MSSDAHLSLALGQEHDVSEWEKAAAAVLRKARRLTDTDPDEAVWEELTRTTIDGIAITPLGTPALVSDLSEPVRPPARGDGWDVRALLVDPDPKASNAAALTDLENGATSLWIQLGTAGIEVAELATVVENVLLDLAPVVLDSPSDPIGAARAFAELAGDQGVAAGSNLGVDPVGARLREVVSTDRSLRSLLDQRGDGAASGSGQRGDGAVSGSGQRGDGAASGSGQRGDVTVSGSGQRGDEAAFESGQRGDGAASESDPWVAETVSEAAGIAQELGCHALVVDGTAVHDLGASDVQELGYVLALGAHYLRVLEAAGISVDEAAALTEFRLAASDDQFVTIAKLRAVRRMWARMLELSGASEEHRGMRLHAVTSRPMMTKYDPWVNMLRTCVAAFAAGVGGADAVTVLPFDARLGLPDAFARRIARNTSTLLVEEAHVAKVADPAGGAFAVEKLTDDLALAGWEELGRIESAGGVLGALEDGSLRGRIDEVVAQRDQQVATRQLALTGVTEFPHLHEILPKRAPYAEGALPVRAYGEPFEAMRDEPATDKVFLATMGPIAAHTARATFAANLFAAGGIDVVNAGRHDDVAAVLSDYSGSTGGQSVVCLTGTDKEYAAWGADLVAALREAGASWVILAGKPVEGLLADDTCAMGVDALDFLGRTRAKLETNR